MKSGCFSAEVAGSQEKLDPWRSLHSSYRWFLDILKAIPELLELLKIAIDAMGCQRKICKNPVIKRRIMD